jgi:hypothetical protein
MPQVKYLSLTVNNYPVDLPPLSDLKLVIDYLLSKPEDWSSKQGAAIFSVDLPATPNNDKIFGTFHSPQMEDTFPDGLSPRQWMTATFTANGSVILFQGKALLQSATHREIPESYQVSFMGGSGDWLIDGVNFTLWDCVNPNTHYFTLETIQNSWRNYDTAGDGSDDFAYIPVRYRQPFQYTDPTGVTTGNDDQVNAFHLRPSISIYWLIQRGFSQLGYTVQSDFLNSQFFRKLVLAWTWGDFLDVNGSAIETLSFKSYGTLPGTPTFTYGYFYSQNTLWASASELLPGSQIVKTGGSNYFQMPNVQPPNGYDNFNLYSFDESTGRMQYTFNVPPELVNIIGSNATLSFTLSAYVQLMAIGGDTVDVQLEIYQNGVFVSSNSILPGGGPITGDYPGPTMTSWPTKMNNSVTPTIYNFYVSNANPGDVFTFQLIVLTTGATAYAMIMQAGYLNANPSSLAVPDWQYDPILKEWVNIASSHDVPQAMYTTLTMNGLSVQMGSPVNLKEYDNFRNYPFFNLLRSLVSMFDLEIQTDPVNKVVLIEPFAPTYTLPTYNTYGAWVADVNMTGYFSLTKIQDWSTKRDLWKSSTMELFSDCERQIDFTFKQDGSDGGQNIWAARYKAIYLNNVVKPKINNDNIDNGIIAGVPGASRYMLPDRFSKGNKQLSNQMISALMHYNHSVWATISESGGVPQLPTIFPDNISGSSAAAITATFEPKIMFYRGQGFGPADFGGWWFAGDPNSPYDIETATSFGLPFAFMVNYKTNTGAQHDPVLTYCDQRVFNGTTPVLVPGLMRKFLLPRLALMRNGQYYKPWIQLNYNDVTNWFHREAIKMGASLFFLMNITDFTPLNDDSTQCEMWRFVNPDADDLANCYPSSISVMDNPATLSQFDLKYAQLLLFMTDIPQI